MHTVITPERIELPPGTVVRMLGSWQEYQVFSQQIGDRAARLGLNIDLERFC